MGYVKHDRTKNFPQALIGDPDTIYYVSDNRAIVMGGLEYGRKLVILTQDEFTQLVKNAELNSGTLYHIKGFTTSVNGATGLKSAGHKIDLYVEALGPTEIKSRAYATYNTDETDTYYEDIKAPVYEWDIKVSISESELGNALSASITDMGISQLYVGSGKAAAHNTTDTLIVVYNNSDKVGISKDGGVTFHTKTLPYFYTDIQDIIYGNGTFVIFDSEGILCVSKDDGETWKIISDHTYAISSSAHMSTNNYAYGYASACYGNDQFYIVGNYVGIKSQDGINWTSFYWKGFDNGWGKPAIAAGDGIIGITAYQLGIYWSINGGSFSQSSPDSTYWEGICFGNHTFTIIAGNRHAAVVRNTDQITSIEWPDGSYNYTVSIAKDPGKVVFNNGTFYCFSAFRSEAAYSYSDDGYYWTSLPLPKVVYEGGYGQTTADFGPNGEMYFVDTISGGIWMNPTPKNPDTWEIILPSNIDTYLHSAVFANNCIVVPLESSSYYLSSNSKTYVPYKFPEKMTSGGVISTENGFLTMLYNYSTKKLFEAKSIDGLNWELSELTQNIQSPCITIAADNFGTIVVYMFENGQKLCKINGQFKSITSTNYNPVCITYCQKSNSFIYSGQQSEANVTTVTQLQVINNEVSVKDISLPQAMMVKSIGSDGFVVYVSGIEKSTSTCYTYAFDIESNTWNSLEVSGCVTHAIKSGFKVIACTNEGNMYVFNYGQVIEVPSDISGLYKIGHKSLLSQSSGTSDMKVLNYTIFNDLQITELTDEFNNTCRFDFKNLKIPAGDKNVFFFENDGDHSLTGSIVNFKQNYGKDDICLTTRFEVNNDLNNVELVDKTYGIFTFPIGGRHITIGPLNTDCNFQSLTNVIRNPYFKWVCVENDELVVSDMSTNTNYRSSDKGSTWSN